MSNQPNQKNGIFRKENDKANPQNPSNNPQNPKNPGQIREGNKPFNPNK